MTAPEPLDTPYYADDWLTIHEGDCRTVMSAMEPESVHCVVTSPPYWGLRDYGTPGQLGLEPTPEAYVESMVDVFREVRRVLRPDGTVWLNIGDSYASHDPGGYRPGEFLNPDGRVSRKERVAMSGARDNGEVPFEGATGSDAVLPARPPATRNRAGTYRPDGLKPKDLVGIPWRVAFALQADGWYLRSDIIWSKPNPMPESVTDRPTKSHEYVFLLSKSPRYYFDADAVREDAKPESAERYATGYKQFGVGQFTGSPTDIRGPKAIPAEKLEHLTGRNIRSVWTIATQPYPGAHFAVFPQKLVEPCILAGCPEGGTVLDPFAGSGTTGLVAQRLSRRAILIDLNPEYLRQVIERNRDVPLGLGA